MLYRLHGQPKTSAANPFSDVAPGTYYENAVRWAADAGIVNGIGGGRFAPDQLVTRQEAMTIFFRYVSWMGLDNGARTEKKFADSANLSEYAREAARWSVANGIILGDDQGRLLPLDTATRAQSVTILKRVEDYVAANTVVKEPAPEIPEDEPVTEPLKEDPTPELSEEEPIPEVTEVETILESTGEETVPVTTETETHLALPNA